MVRKRMRRWAVAAALVGVLGGCGSDSDTGSAGGDGPPEPNTVELRDIEFKPEKLRVEVGDTVTWRFEDEGIAHDVVADDKSFKSEIKDSGTFEHTFEKAGTYNYFCSLHSGPMKGTIEVVEG